MLEGDPSRMAAGTGSYYRTELIASANYCFDRRRQYRTALDLYNAADRIEPLEEGAAMWRASSMVRISGLLEEGNAEYARLVWDYPGNIGMKRSHVDALLAVEQYEMARSKLDEYNLKAAENDWHAQQWGRVRLGLHEYEEAIAIFTRLRDKNPGDPFLVTYLARALQQFGDLDGAITVLETGLEDFPDNVSITTSLATNLERSRRHDSRAKDMLQRLFDTNHANARAALSLVRLLRREDAVEAARTVMRKLMEADVIRSMRPFMHMAQAELLMAQKRPASAAAYIRDNLTDDESPGLLIDALLEAADDAQDPDVRDAFMREAAQVQVPGRLRHNVPVQVDRAKLGTRLGNREMFDEAIANLSETRIDRAELERLKSQFE
jgi:predicted Zn-dependent protease